MAAMADVNNVERRARPPRNGRIARALNWLRARRTRIYFRAANAVPYGIWRVRLAARSRLKRYVPIPLRDVLYRYVLPRTATVAGNRRYIKDGLERSAFAAEFQRRHVRYAVLRWFEDFPDWPAGEDMDILIDPADVAKVSDLFQLKPNGRAVDLFSTDGSKNLAYGNVSYFPADFARRILDGAASSAGGCRVPSSRDHFFSLAYHAVYHKCEQSGLPSRDGHFPQAEGEHDYGEVLRALAARIGVTSDFSIEGLHALMRDNGVAPNLDTLRKLATRKPNLRAFLPAEACDRRGGELVAIVVREWAMAHGFLPAFKAEIEKELRFEILKEIPLDAAARARARAAIRGGDWGAGPNPQSGGGPAALLLCFDYHPAPPSAQTAALHPFVKNENVIRAKAHLRDFAHDRTPFREHANPVHTADDELEALDYAQTVAPEAAGALRAELDALRDAYATRFPVRALFSSNRRRAKVELIDFGGKPAVKKTFRPSARDYMRHEVGFIRSLNGECAWLPEILEVGDNYFVMPLYENTLAAMPKRKWKRTLRARAKEIVGIMRFFHERGYALMDFHPRNLILEPAGRLILVDFEYVHRYREKPARFLDAFDVAGVPVFADGTLADGAREQAMTYDIAWRPLLGPIGRYV